MSTVKGRNNTTITVADPHGYIKGSWRLLWVIVTAELLAVLALVGLIVWNAR